MAGLYDRINTSDNINIHYIVAGIKGYGTMPLVWTRAAVLANVNSLLTTPLDAASVVDFGAIADVLDGNNAVGKLGYVNQVEGAMIAAESGVLGESGWRTALEIS